MSANHKADAAWDDYVSQQQEEKIEELERELNAANESFRKLNIHALDLAARIKRLEEFVDQLTNPKFTRDDLPKEALLQRIKRLEEAGEKMVDEPLRKHRRWILNEAKEAKP